VQGDRLAVDCDVGDAPAGTDQGSRQLEGVGEPGEHLAGGAAVLVDRDVGSELLGRLQAGVGLVDGDMCAGL
jgi:hypothetical protein